jgi:CheY-like chemotaxis protein
MTLAEATVLVVDDEPVLRFTFSILLKQAGATVHSAENGAEALDVLKREHIDIILTDKQMPVMDGLTLLHKARESGMMMPAIFFVNGVASESPAEMDRLHVVRTVTKPIHPSDLARVLEEALGPLPSRG